MEIDETGKKLKTYVRAAGAVIAWQTVFHQTGGSVVEQLRFEHEDASAMSRKMTAANGDTILGSGEEDSMAEFDTTGNSVGVDNPYPDMSITSQGEGCIGCGSSGIMTIDDNSRIMVNGARTRCRWDNVLINCGSVGNLLAIGLAVPANETTHRVVGGTFTEEVTHSTAPGWATITDTDGSQTTVWQPDGTLITNITLHYTWSPQQQTKKDTPFSNVAGLRKELQRRLNLNNGECRKKLNDVLNALKKEFENKKLKLTGFDALAEKFLGGKNKLLEVMAGYSNYNSSTKKLTMNVNPTRGAGFVPLMEAIGGEFIHEVLHGASKRGFSHEDIVIAIAKVEGINFNNLKTGETAADTSPNGPNDQSVFEQPMNFWISKYCGGDGKRWDNLYQKYKNP